MTTEQFEARTNELIEEALNKLSEELLNEFDHETRVAIETKVVAEVYNREADKDPEFKEAYVNYLARLDVARYLNEHRPIGAFRSDGLIPLSSNQYKEMSLATRADLIAWREMETDPANISYIVSRLQLWKPDYANLADLERSL